LWRRRLRRRPLLPFLLAATLAVDVVLAASLQASPNAAFIAGFGFLLGQIGLLAVWSLHTPRWIAQRLLLALGVTVIVGRWFLSTEAEDIPWYTTFVLAIDCIVLAGFHWIRQRRKLLHTKRRRFGIGGILAWTTIAAVAIAALRSVDGGLITAVLQEHEVWSGVLIDALVLVIAVTATSWKWRAVPIVFVVTLGSVALLIGKMALSRIVQMGFVYYLNADYVSQAQQAMLFGLAYQATFVATILIWLLGIRYAPPVAQTELSSEVELESAESIDLSA
jgi:hypothetical protein